MNEQEGLMNVRDVARACNRSEETVRRWIWSGKLRARKLGSQLFVERGDLEAMLAPRAAEAKAAYGTRLRKRGERRTSEATKQILAHLMEKRDELVARHGAAHVDELLRQVRAGEAFYPARLFTKEEKLAALERAVALGKEIRAKYGPVNVSDLIHEIREDDD